VSDTSRDYYEVLGVARGADAATIKRAFRARARLLHPDVSHEPDAELKFRELADAYSALSKPAARLLYDRFGYRGRGAWAPSPAAAQAFHGLFSRRRPRAGGDVAEIELGFYEAARGAKRTVSYVLRVPCSSRAHENDCPACAGRGHVRQSDDEGSVRVLQLVTCSACGGSGRTAAACDVCGGSGETEERREVEVTIPSGVEDGARLPLDDGSHVVVRVGSQPVDSVAVRAAAAVGLVAALAFLVFLLLN
jgi:molecular chaperone DnaJ